MANRPARRSADAALSTNELIQQALAAQEEFQAASDNMAQATGRLQAARDALVLANQRLHDDLAANGPAVVVDSSTTPATVTMYSAVDPDSWLARPIRVAA